MVIPLGSQQNQSENHNHINHLSTQIPAENIKDQGANASNFFRQLDNTQCQQLMTVLSTHLISKIGVLT